VSTCLSGRRKLSKSSPAGPGALGRRAGPLGTQSLSETE
jgi:hypothetical protein